MKVANTTRKMLVRFRWQIAVTAIVGLAALLRLVHLGSVPLPLADEVFAAVDWHALLSTGRHFDGSRAGLLAYIIPALDGRLIASFVLGGDLPDLRLVSAGFGILTVALMVPFGLELGSLAFGLLAATALAIMPWDIYLSRIFFPASEYLFLTVLTLLLAAMALRKKSMLAGIGSATAGVASFYLYPVAIVATPLLALGVLIVRRQQLLTFGLRKALTLGLIAALLLVPYLVDHFVMIDPSVGNQGNIIAQKMIWNHGSSLGSLANQFLLTWLSYMSIPFTVLTGDPNVRVSIQAMGSVGWVAGAVGWIGVIIALGRRNSTDRLLLFWLASFPVADALTYSDAFSNSVRAITGAFVWALLIATGILAIARLSLSWLRIAIASAIGLGMAAQMLAFSWLYFGQYDRYAYAFETGYSKIYPILRQKSLESIPITLHAGYQRDAMLQYFSQYHLHASDQVLACFSLSYDDLRPKSLPRIFVIREDPDVQATPGCIHGGLISLDRAALSDIYSGPGGVDRNIDVIAVFPNDGTGKYSTAILYLHY